MKITIDAKDLEKITNEAVDKATNKVFTAIDSRINELDMHAIAIDHLRQTVTVKAEVAKKCYEIASQQIAELDIESMLIGVLTHIATSRLTRLNNPLLEQLLANQKAADSIFERVSQAAADAEELVEKLRIACAKT